MQRPVTRVWDLFWFSHLFGSRAAWLKQPFPDKEGPQDRHFLEALQRALADDLQRILRGIVFLMCGRLFVRVSGQDIKVLLPKQPRDAALAACGWCQQNLSTAQVGVSRWRWTDVPHKIDMTVCG